MRRTPLRPPTVEEVRSWERRARRPIRKLGRKAQRERTALAFFTAGVAGAARSFCQAAGLGICNHLPHYGSTAHHMWPEDRDAGRHEISRGKWLCWAAHRWVHEHPARAKQLGLLRPEAAS